MTGAETMSRLLQRLPGVATSGAGVDPLRVLRSSAPGDRAYQEAFSALVEAHRDKVFRLALSILGPAGAAEAEDVAQEVFLAVFRRLHTFRSESRFATWVYRIAYRKAIDVRRRARFRHPHTNDEVLATLATTGPAGQTANDALPIDERIRLYAAVEALPEAQRSAVYLHYWLGETVESIARLLGRRPGTVKSHLHRARARLGRLLGAETHEEKPR